MGLPDIGIIDTVIMLANVPISLYGYLPNRMLHNTGMFIVCSNKNHPVVTRAIEAMDKAMAHRNRLFSLWFTNFHRWWFYDQFFKDGNIIDDLPFIDDKHDNLI